MIKARITYDDKKEADEAIKILDKNFDIISISRPYRNTRSNDKYSRIYIDLKNK